MPTNPSAEATGTPGSAAGSILAGLGNRFVELFGRGLSKQEFAAEMARLIAEAVRVRAVAVLVCEPRRHHLILLAQRGLTREARNALGEGGECHWDIPLRGLRNRRISVIAAAHQNPFVPRAFAQASPGGLAIASLPIYREYGPAGVLLLFASGSRAFPDALLHTLSQALRVCARGLAEPDGQPGPLPSRGGEEESVDAAIAKLIDEQGATDSLAAPATSRRDDRGAAPQLHLVEPQAARSDATPQLVEDMIAHVQRVEARLTQTLEELERNAQAVRTLTASRHALLRERDGLQQRITELEQAHETDGVELRAQVSALEERLLAVDAERARHQRLNETRQAAAQQSLAALETERSALLERVRAAETASAESQAALEAERSERARVAALAETLGSEVRTAQETLQRERTRDREERTALEADRDGWKEQATTTGAQLAQHTEALVSLDRDRRSTIVARDAATTQLQAAREEIARLTALTEELEQRTAQADAARAAGVADAAALRRAVEEERAGRRETEQARRADLDAAQTQEQQRTAEVAALRDELAQRSRAVAERDEQLSALRQEREASRCTAADWQDRHATLQAEVATLTARLEQTAAERQQLVGELASSNTSLAEIRKRASQAEIERAVALSQAQAQIAELHRHIEELTDDRDGLAARLERTIEEGKDLALRLGETQRHTHDLGEQLGERQALIETVAAEREQLAAQVSTLTGQLQAAREAAERAEARDAQERTALESDRDGWKEQAGALNEELARRSAALTLLQDELHSTRAASDAAAVELQTAREELEQQVRVAEELTRTAAQLDTARTGLATEGRALREMLENERAEHARTEQVLRADLAALRADAERLTADTTTLHEQLAARADTVAERDAQLAALRAEIAALQEQGADREVLLREAAELQTKIEALERSAAALRADAECAEQQRAILAQQAEAAQRRQQDAAEAASHERAQLEGALRQLTAERERLAVACAQRDDELAAMRAEGERAAAQGAALRQEVAQRTAEVARLGREQEAARQERAEWERRGAGLQAEVEAVRAALEASRAECEQGREHGAVLERQLALVTAQQGEAAQVLAQELAAARQQMAQLEQAREEQRAAAQAARQRVREVEAAQQAAGEQAAAQAAHWHEQVQALTAAREALRERGERAEQALAAHSARAQQRVEELEASGQRLEQALAAAEARGAAREAAAAEALAELAAARQQSAEREEVAQQASELGHTVAALEQALAVARGEGARAERQRGALAQELEGVRQQQAQASAAAAQAQQQWEAAAQQWSEQRARLEAAHAAQEQQAAAQQAAVATLQRALEQQGRERAAQEQQAQDVAQRLADAHRRLDELGAQLTQRQAALETASADRQRLEDALHSAEALAEQLTGERDDQRHAANAAADRLEKERLDRIKEVLALQKELAGIEGQQRDGRILEAQVRRHEERVEGDYDAPLIIERSAPLDAALDAGAEAAETPTVVESSNVGVQAGELVLIDAGRRGDEACAALHGAGFEVTRAAVGDATIDELARRKINCVMLNLAAGPAAWRMLRLLRERAGTRDLPVLAYLMQPDAPKGFCFGRADFGIWPMDPERMVERIGHLRARVKRVLAVSADVDGINRLREPLANAGISTSVVLDGKQLLEFAAMVQPDAVVVHLSPDCPAVGRALAGLRADEATRTLPVLVLLDRTPAREEAFFASTAHELSLKSNFLFSNLPSEIARLLA